MSKKTVSGTREWAASSVNVMLGCEHDCRYCYARSSAARFGRKGPEDWPNEIVQPNLLAKGFGKRDGTVMFPTTHDLTPDNLEHTGAILARLLEAGNDVLVVSKPHASVIQNLCERFTEYKDQILFRFTIGSDDDTTLQLWEPGAPSFKDRLLALKHAKRMGFKTSVSMEPMLESDEEAIVTLVDELQAYVTDAIWIGKMNRAVERLRRNGFGDDEALMAAAKALVVGQADEHILSLYERLKDNPVVRWKESIKKVVGLEIPTEAGLDV
tara:strand:- start:2987 stop:3793 length:807 start_codon:yes stop_codon:yes gene_type:complete